MYVIVEKVISKEELYIEIPDKSTVGELKQAIHEKDGAVLLEDMTLKLDERIMKDDEKLLGYYGVHMPGTRIILHKKRGFPAKKPVGSSSASSSGSSSMSRSRRGY